MGKSNSYYQTEQLKKVSRKITGEKTKVKTSRKRMASRLMPIEVFSTNFSWPTKIAYVLAKLKKATAEQVAAEINELQGSTSQEEVADVVVTVSEFLNKLLASGKIKASKQIDKQIYFALIQKYHLK